MQKFELVLKNDKEKPYNLISWIVIILNIIFICWLSINASSRKQIAGFIFIAIIVFSLIVPRYFKNRGERPGFTGTFILLGLGWLNTGYWWMFIVTLFFEVLNTITSRQLIVYVNSEKIIYPSWPKKVLKWFEISNVILKDRLLTIDMKNNKLFQQEVINSENDHDIDETEFNNFCNEQLNKAELYKLN